MINFMTENTRKNINFDYIFNEIKPITEYGIKKKQEAQPFKRGQEADLKIEYGKIRAFIENSKRRDAIDTLRHIKNISETVERAFKNQILDEVELFEVKNFLIQVKKMAKIIRGILYVEDLKLYPLPDLYQLLDPANEKINTFYMYDEYSEKLKSIRDEKKELQKELFILKRKNKEYVELKYGIKFNFKDELIINKAEKDKIEKLNIENKLRILGENYINIIYALKNDVYIDEIEKRLEILSLNEDEEELYIREKISQSIKNKYDELVINMDTIGQIDYIIAKANCAQKTNSVEPEITTKLEIVVMKGRNLKLEDALKVKHKEYTKVDLNLRKNVVCITGANMGGKTVSLRMVGQIVAAASYGMFVPCESAKLCLFDQIHISVGDDQSLEKGLSTFGAEMINLKDAIESSDKRCLILIDELAGGTNPKEGYAITKAVVNYFKSKDCITVLTTHYDNVANDYEVQNLQVTGLKFPESFNDGINIEIKNINQISKYMDYTLIEVEYNSHIPKNALKIAQMVGIPDEIIKDAEKFL